MLESIKEILSNSWNPILGYLFLPIYIIVNTASCGRMGDTELAGCGLGSLTIGIMLESVGTCFSGTVATPVAIAYGANDKRMCRVYLNR